VGGKGLWSRRGSGRFSAAMDVSDPTDIQIKRMITGNMNNDNKLDIIGIDDFSTSIFILYNSGNGRFLVINRNNATKQINMKYLVVIMIHFKKMREEKKFTTVTALNER
jgi:hypothetical protein